MTEAKERGERRPPISLQELRRRIYHKAKSEKDWRFWGIYVHMCRKDTLWESYRMAKANEGAPGVDGETFKEIEEGGVEKFLMGIREGLLNQTYEPQSNRHREIPKRDGKTMRKLGIPTIRDRVVQGAVRLILEPIFEADFCENSFGYRPGRGCAGALHRVGRAVIGEGLTEVVDVDLSSYFDNIRHHLLFARIARRVDDRKVMWLIKKIVKAGGKKGVAQGGPLSPVLSNLYLTDVDKVFKEGEEKTRVGKHPRMVYTRYADDMAIAVGRHPHWPNLKGHIQRRLREELDKLEVKVNEEKTKVVDLAKGESFTYLGFDCRWAKNRKGKLFLLKTPRKKKRKELMEKIRGIIRSSGRRTVREVVGKTNPVVRGWVNYYRIGNATKVFRFMRNQVERRIRRFAMKKRKRQGYGWKRWSKEVVYGRWGLFDAYRVCYYRPLHESALQFSGV